MTGPLFLLDTNVVIGLSKGPGPARDLADQKNAAPALCAISQITRIELLSYWALGPAEKTWIDTLLSAVTVIVLDDRVEHEAIALRRRTRLKLPDAIIAATAVVHGLTLLTLDDRLSAAVAAA